MMKQLHECPRNIQGMDYEIYTYDKSQEKSWYLKGHIIFYCPYCGIDLKHIRKDEKRE